MLFQTSMTYVTSVEQSQQTKTNIFTNVSAIFVQTMIVNGTQNNLDPIDLFCIDEKTLRHLLTYNMFYVPQNK